MTLVKKFRLLSLRFGQAAIDFGLRILSWGPKDMEDMRLQRELISEWRALEALKRK